MVFIRSTMFLIVFVSTLAFVQTKPARSLSQTQVHESIKELLKFNEFENEYARFLSYLKIYPQEDNLTLRALFDDYFSMNSYLNDLTNVYAKYFTPDEILELIKFYTSPLGEKYNRFTNVLNTQMEDTMLTKISDYIFTAAEYGYTIRFPDFK